ncbi:MAG: hypothetical protein ACD_75C01235G0005 [uncultured bacterium]|nr:MAG: hypothetical protein ACD_75C01235G0005 [uncultured bacterium]
MLYFGMKSVKGAVANFLRKENGSNGYWFNLNMRRMKWLIYVKTVVWLLRIRTPSATRSTRNTRKNYAAPLKPKFAVKKLR